jgi:hypothetical protein
MKVCWQQVISEDAFVTGGEIVIKTRNVSVNVVRIAAVTTDKSKQMAFVFVTTACVEGYQQARSALLESGPVGNSCQRMKQLTSPDGKL